MHGRLILYFLFVLLLVAVLYSCGKKGPPTLKDYRASIHDRLLIEWRENIGQPRQLSYQVVWS